MPADTVETRVAVLETKVAAMQGDHAETVRLLKELSTDLHAIKETIATGKGAWWAAAGIIGLLTTGGGIIGAFVHKAATGSPFPAP